MAKIPARTRVGVIDWTDTLVEIVEYDHTYDLIRECKKLVWNFPAEVAVGWKYLDAKWLPPLETKGGV